MTSKFQHYDEACTTVLLAQLKAFSFH